MIHNKSKNAQCSLYTKIEMIDIRGLDSEQLRIIKEKLCKIYQGIPLLSYYRNFLSYKYMTISWRKTIIDIQGWSQAVQQK